MWYLEFFKVKPNFFFIFIFFCGHFGMRPMGVWGDQRTFPAWPMFWQSAQMSADRQWETTPQRASSPWTELEKNCHIFMNLTKIRIRLDEILAERMIWSRFSGQLWHGQNHCYSSLKTTEEREQLQYRDSCENFRHFFVTLTNICIGQVGIFTEPVILRRFFVQLTQKLCDLLRESEANGAHIEIAVKFIVIFSLLWPESASVDIRFEHIGHLCDDFFSHFSK